MKTQTGYIVPVILIVILLVLAGVVTFGIPSRTEAPELNTTQQTPVVSPRPTATQSPETPATTTATTSIEMDIGGEAIVE